MARSRLAVLACLVTLAQPRAGIADPIHNEAVFSVRAKDCPKGATRNGTAFLVKDWPDKGEVSLVTALHVVHGCSSLDIKSSSCDNPPNQPLVSLNGNSGVSVRMWPKRDLIVFRHVKGQWASARPAFEWTPLKTTSTTGRPVVTVGATGKSVCYPDPGPVKSSIQIGKVIPKGLGSIDPLTVVLVYELGAAGASGGPVTDQGTEKVIAVHEAGFETEDKETAAIAIVDDDDPVAGTAIDNAFPDWSNVNFTPPPRPHALAEAGEDAASRASVKYHLGPLVAVEFGGPIAWSQGARYRLEGAVAWELRDPKSASPVAIGGRFTVGGVLAVFDEPRRDPSGAEFDKGRRVHGGPSAAIGAYLRTSRFSALQFELGGAFRTDFIWEAPEGASREAAIIPGLMLEPRLIGMWKTFALTLGGRIGLEYAPLFAYQYGLFPVTLTRESHALRLMLGASLGLDWGFK